MTVNWSEEEDELIMMMYPSEPLEELVDKLHNRSISTVYQRAYKLGVFRIGTRNQLYRYRKQELGSSQGEIAEMIGVSKATYGTWERGDVDMLFSSAVKMADALDITVDDLQRMLTTY